MSKKTTNLSVFMTAQESANGFVFLIFNFFVLPVLLQLLAGLLPTPLRSAKLNFIYYIIQFAVAVGTFRRFLLRSLEAAGSRFWNFLLAAISGFCGYFVSSELLSWVLRTLFPSFSNVNDAALAAMVQSDLILIAIGTVLLVPMAEECFFRGLIFGRLHERSRILAYAVSTAAFGAIHVMGYIGAHDPITLLLCFLQYIPAGLCLAWACEKADSIFAPILIHTAVNAIAVFTPR